MADDLFKLIILFWGVAVLYLLYSMAIDLKNVADLIYAYMQLALEHMRR